MTRAATLAGLPRSRNNDDALLPDDPPMPTVSFIPPTAVFILELVQ